MFPLRTLVVYASFGEGHKKAALCLQNYLNSACYDLLNFSQPWVSKFSRLGYLYITERLPAVWDLIFNATSKKIIIYCFEKTLKLFFYKFIEHIREIKPRVIIATHFFPPFLLSALKRNLGFKIIVIVTDFNIHPLWANKDVDLYFTADSAGRDGLVNLGIAVEKIKAGFVSLRKEFFESFSEEGLRRKLNLPDMPCILFMSSVRGRFPFIKKIINRLKGKFAIIVVYGRNLRLKKYLQKLNLPSIRYFQFYEDVWELMAVSFAIVTKPGGITVFEGISLKKPFIFTKYIPGQEEGNMRFLIELGMGRYVKNSNQFLSAVNHFYRVRDNLSNEYPVQLNDIRLALRQAVDKFLN